MDYHDYLDQQVILIMLQPEGHDNDHDDDHDYDHDDDHDDDAMKIMMMMQ